MNCDTRQSDTPAKNQVTGEATTRNQTTGDKTWRTMPKDQTEWYSENTDSGMLKMMMKFMDKMMSKMDRLMEMFMRVLGLSDVVQGGTRAAGAVLTCSGVK